MLPATVRMRRREDFAVAVRKGRRAGRGPVTFHLLRSPGADEPPRIGFVVSRAVGGAVVRNRVRRQLRHLARGYLGVLPQGSLLVVRANPPAATVRQAELAAEFDLVLNGLLRR